MATNRSTRNSQLNLALGSANQLRELLNNTFQKTQTIVVRQRSEEILNCVVLILSTSVFLQFGDDLRLILGGKGWC